MVLGRTLCSSSITPSFRIIWRGERGCSHRRPILHFGTQVGGRGGATHEAAGPSSAATTIMCSDNHIAGHSRIKDQMTMTVHPVIFSDCTIGMSPMLHDETVARETLPAMGVTIAQNTR